MQVRIKETGAVNTLSIIDPKTGCDYIADYIGNTGALNDGQFTRSEIDEMQECDTETYAWWVSQVERQTAANERMAALAEKHGSDAVFAALQDAYSGEFESEPEEAMAAMDAEFGAD